MTALHRPRKPLEPLFNPKTRYGAVTIGITPGTIPPQILAIGTALETDTAGPITLYFPTLALVGSVFDATYLDNAIGVYRVGSYAYVGAFFAGFTVVDVSTPATPSVVANDASGLLGTSSHVVVDGSYAYVLSPFGNALVVVDITNPLVPSIVGSVADATTLNAPRCLVKDGNYCYVTATSARLTVVDVTTPTAPSVTGSISNSVLSGANGLTKDGNYCYVACGTTNRLTIVDVSTPATPTISAFTSSDATNLGSAHDVVKSGNIAYVTAANTDRVSIYDVTNPAATPTLLASVTDALLNEPLFLVKSGPRLLVACAASDSVTVVDVTNPAAPFVDAAASLTDSTNLDGANDIFLDGTLVFVTANAGDRLTILSYT